MKASKIFKIYIDSFSGLSQEAWMLSIVMFINRTGSMVLPFLGVYMTDKLGFTLEQTGFVLSFYGIGSVLGSFIGGYLTDKIGEYKVQLGSLFLSAPLFLLIPYFTSVMGLALIILLESIISEAFRPANSVAITKYAKPQNITRAFSLNRMAINLGFSIGPALGGILSSISYNLLFVANFVAIFLAGIFYLYFFRKRNKSINRALDISQVKKQTVVKSPYKDLPFIAFCIFCTIFSICFFQILNTLPLFYKESAQLSQTTIGFILGYSGFIIVILEMLLVHFAEKKLSISQTLFIGTIFCAIGYGMLGFTYTLIAILISMTIICFGEILALPFMSTVTAKRSENGNKGAYMGLNGMAFSVSFIITPILGTKIASMYGFSWLWIGTAILSTISAVGLYYTTKYMFKRKSRE